MPGRGRCVPADVQLVHASQPWRTSDGARMDKKKGFGFRELDVDLTLDIINESLYYLQ